MRVARYWAYGETSAATPDGEDVHRSLWRGSDESEAAARAAVDRALAELARRVQSGQAVKEWYEYLESSRPEPIVEDVPGENGERAAAVTLNRYGATILNTARVPFIDVDLEDVPASGFLARVFGGKLSSDQARDQALAKLREWVGARRDRVARVYRTAAGLRYLLPATEMDPAGDEAAALLRLLGSDERYANLCRVQRCYRARLSPKPWRIGVPSPPGHIKYGRETEGLVDWSRGYEAASAGFAVCELVSVFGDAPGISDAARIIELHDAATRVGSGLPLA